MQEASEGNRSPQAPWRWQNQSVPALPVARSDTTIQPVEDVIPPEQIFRFMLPKCGLDSQGRSPDAHENPELTLGSLSLEQEAPEVVVQDTPLMVLEQPRVASLRPGLLEKAGIGPLLVPSTRGIVDFSALGSIDTRQQLGRRRGPMTAADFKEAMRQMNDCFGKAINEIVSETVACRG